MILTKDLQEILEGVHYFLAEALTRESLSGRAECLRRGLVLQLEALAGVYPTLRIQPSQPGGVGGVGGPKGAASSASLPYLPMDQSPRCTGPHSTTTTTTSYSSSSSGVNSHSSSSSSGSSGDGLVLGGRRGGPAAPVTEEGGGGGAGEQGEELYEEFDDCKDEGVEIKSEKGGGGGGGGGEGREEGEEEDGVYMETDELVAFSSLIATCERHGALGKKTKGLLRNVKSYLCVVAGGMLYLYLKETDDRQKKTIDLTGYTARSATGEDIKDTKKRDAAFEIVCPGKKTHTFIARTAKDKQDWLDALSRTMMRSGKIRPSLARPPALSPASFFTPTPPSHPSMPPRPPAAPAPTPQCSSGQPSALEYTLYHDVADELYEEIEGEQGCGLSLPSPPPGLLSPTPPPPVPPHQATTTTTTTRPDYDPVQPENPPIGAPAFPRPPPPARPPLPPQLQGQAGQYPLQATDDPGADSDDSQGIYCEIEEDMLETARIAYPDTFGGSGGQEGNAGVPSTTQQDSFIPPSTAHKPQLPSVSSGPPKIPPKGLPPQEHEESEYKVPQSTDGEYHVPSSPPVPTEAGRGAVVGKISSPLPTPASILQVSHTQTIVPIKPVERRKSVVEDKKAAVSSFRSRDTDTQRPLKPMPGTSVRDMIARLNQKKPPPDSTESQDGKIEEEEEKPVGPPSASIPLPKQHLRTDKPPLPTRPPNLSPQPPPSQPEGGVGEGKVEEEDLDEIYDVLDGDDGEGEVTQQQQGEWYVAKFAFVATLDQALSFGRGDELLVFDTSGGSGWWRATHRGKNGLVPREYLKKKE